jgi:hypothetical protein
MGTRVPQTRPWPARYHFLVNPYSDYLDLIPGRAFVAPFHLTEEIFISFLNGGAYYVSRDAKPRVPRNEGFFKALSIEA